jgi:histone H3/H4
MKRKLNILNYSNKKQRIKIKNKNKNKKIFIWQDIDLLIKMFKKLKLNNESKNNFKSLCCNVLPSKFKFSVKSLQILKEVSEDYLCRIFQLANLFKTYRNKKTLIVDDLLLAQYFIRT